jgi:hypothetical protein
MTFYCNHSGLFAVAVLAVGGDFVVRFLLISFGLMPGRSEARP